MSASKKDRFITTAAGRFKVPQSIVRLIVEAWEHERKTPGGNGNTVELGPAKGGWYTLPDGSKVQGREAALEALEALK